MVARASVSAWVLAMFRSGQVPVRYRGRRSAGVQCLGKVREVTTKELLVDTGGPSTKVVR